MQIKRINFEGTSATKVESTHSLGPRGYYYSYLIYIDNSLVAVGEEQGNYAGGIYARKDNRTLTPEIIDELPLELKEYIKCK